ncbi:hypothetical protein [Filomicrobium sp.]|uniref:hypothetical protein n=1 Tax=Filomicrobium sp. TaxID=2024831 RepID=UPI002588F1C0|nr:hypothetical protein [Filomicrobium sp.]MCV0371097.1 hypothetical protein [Filomicrobium sp.]
MLIKLILWAVLGLVLFGLFVFGAALSGISISQQARDFLSQAAPSWLQGLSTAVAAALAFAAYVEWRRPDDARRRANTAQLILRQSQKLENAAASARYGTIAVMFTQDKELLSEKMNLAESLARKPMPKKVAQLESELHNLRTFRAEATMLYIDRPVAALMDAVSVSCESILRGHSRIKMMNDSLRSLLKDDERFEKVLSGSLEALGASILFVWELDGPEVDDPFWEKVQDQFDTLRNELLTYLVDQR